MAANPLPPFVEKNEDFIEVGSPDGIFDTPKPVLNGGGKPVTTVWEMAECSMLEYADSNCFGVREYLKEKRKKGEIFGNYTWITYEHLHDLCEFAGSALVRMGTKKNELCAVFGSNTPEYMVSILGAARQGCIPVPLSYYCSASELAGVLRRTGLRVMICNPAVFHRFVAACEILQREDCPLTVQAVVLMRGIPHTEIPPPKGSLSTDPVISNGDDGIPEEYIDEQKRRFKWKTVFTWKKFISAGKRHKRPSLVTSGRDIFAVLQTSGTTGEAKDVMLSNNAILNAIDSVCSHPDFAKQFPTKEDIVAYNFTSLSHVSAFTFILSIMRLGGSIGFESSQEKKTAHTMNDLADLRPTIINTVPEVWRQVKNAAEGKTDPGDTGFFTRRLLKVAATKSGKEDETPKKGGATKAIISSVSRNVLGGRVRAVIVCGAYFSPSLLNFVTMALDHAPIQVYGQTEYCGLGLYTPVCATDTSNESFRSTSSGFCPPGSAIRLVTVGDGGRYNIEHNPPTGEIYIHSGGMFSGYLGDKYGTDEVLDDDGWFKTGDVGQLNPDGSISVIERLNDDYKLSSGYFAHTAMLNDAYGLSTLCRHVFTYVNKEYTFVVAVVEVDVKALDDCAMLPSSAREISAKARANPKSSIVKKLLEMPEIADLYIREFARIAEENQFSDHEIIRNVILDAREWNTDNGLLTSSGKLCKLELLRRYQDNLDRLAYEIVNKPTAVLETSKF